MSVKTKNQKRTEAIARNAQYRDKYLDQAEKLGLVGLDAKEYADKKQGIPTANKSYRTQDSYL